MGKTEEILVVDGITKIFGKTNSPHSIVALDNISFILYKGANSILGQNGAGKSTLLKILLGYIHETSGTAQILGHDIKKEGMVIRTKVGYMPENYAIIPGVNAVKQVALMGRISGLPKAEAMQRSHETLQYVGLEESRYRKVNEFSTGMLQRLKLAQALVNDPRLLFLDEPTNGLDPKGRMEMIDLIKEISRSHDIDIIVSSHLLPDIEATCEYATILDKGKVISQGKINELTYQESISKEKRLMLVRIKGNFDSFLKGLQNANLPFEVIDKVIHILYTDSNISHTLLSIAYQTGVQIRMMTPQKAILEDVFVHTISNQHQTNPTLIKKGGNIN
ncbi:MAG: ABC transporter ATP-binding protein [Candidatus Heimdallarchaeota archaeon]|nr:ABC transporter ATP-binding protein [Candidatus Heimdallarchaeota archaeon]